MVSRADHLLQSIPALISWINSKLSTASSAIYRERFGVGVTERRILFQLSIENDISVKRITDAVGTDKGTISRAVAKLESLDLLKVHNNQRDARMRVVGSTRKGRAMLRRMNALSAKRVEFLTSIFSDEEHEQLVEMLQRLLAHIPAAAAYKPSEDEL